VEKKKLSLSRCSLNAPRQSTSIPRVRIFPFPVRLTLNCVCAAPHLSFRGRLLFRCSDRRRPAFRGWGSFFPPLELHRSFSPPAALSRGAKSSDHTLSPPSRPGAQPPFLLTGEVFWCGSPFPYTPRSRRAFFHRGRGPRDSVGYTLKMCFSGLLLRGKIRLHRGSSSFTDPPPPLRDLVHHGLPKIAAKTPLLPAADHCVR